MNKLSIILRWIFLIPLAILLGIAMLFALHIFLMNILTNLTGFITPYPELPERILSPFVFSLTFVLAGSIIAPKYKFYTSVFLFTISMILSGILIWVLLNNLMWFGRTLELQNGGVPFYLSMIGSFLGLYIVSKDFKDFDTESNSLFKELVINILFSFLFLFSIYNPTFRFYFFILFLVLGVFQTISNIRNKLYNTIKSKIRLVYDIVFFSTMLIGLINNKNGLIVSFICFALCIVGYILSIIIHFKKNLNSNNL